MSDHSYDSSGVDPDARPVKELIPEGEYLFQIEKAEAATSKSGYFMVALVCKIINNIDLLGKSLQHWVTFLPKDNKGAGIAIHFLKVIGQPWEGKFDITVADWEGGTFKGVVVHEDSVSPTNGKTYKNAKIKYVNYVNPEPSPAEPSPTAKKAEKIPF